MTTDATLAASDTAMTWLKTLLGTAGATGGAVAAQTATDPLLATWSAIFGLATAGMTMLFVGARLIRTVIEIGERWEAYKVAKMHRKAERQMLHDLGLAPTNPDDLDTRPSAYRK